MHSKYVKLPYICSLSIHVLLMLFMLNKTHELSLNEPLLKGNIIQAKLVSKETLNAIIKPEPVKIKTVKAKKLKVPKKTVKPHKDIPKKEIKNTAKNYETKKPVKNTPRISEDKMMVMLNDAVENEDRQYQEFLAAEARRLSLKIKHAIGSNWQIPIGMSGDLHCKVLIKLDIKGKVLSVDMLASSGNGSFDRSAINAVTRSSPLPMPVDYSLSRKFQEIILTLSPENI
ncbi:MAG: cell envelope integrity protein TolA [Legionellales bacterium]|jgi:TonB family protein|nr:cell envelope integrity protein TolA [Legionellales bacterium]